MTTIFSGIYTIVACLCIIAVLVMMYSWVEYFLLLTSLPGLASMQYYTALGFLFIGLVLLFGSFSKLQIICILLLLLFTELFLIKNIFKLDQGKDQRCYRYGIFDRCLTGLCQAGQLIKIMQYAIVEVVSGLYLIKGYQSKLVVMIQNIISNGIKFIKEEEIPKIEKEARELQFLCRGGVEDVYFDEVFLCLSRYTVGTNMKVLD